MLKFIVLADLHIVAEGSLAHGLDTTDRLNKAIDFVNTNHADADFVIVAGDLADRGDLPAYERFQKAIERLELPVYLTLGNHDDRAIFLSHFGSDLARETGNVDHMIDLKGQRIIILDSSDRSVGGSGLLEKSQLAWLQARLDEVKDTPVIIVLHHNITRFHTQNDFIILKDNAEFADIAGSHPDIRQVISGHVHMTTSGTYKGIPFCTLAGCHYSIDPTLESRSGPRPSPVARREGPGELAVVISDEDATVVHMEKFIDRHLVMAQDLFR